MEPAAMAIKYITELGWRVRFKVVQDIARGPDRDCVEDQSQQRRNAGDGLYRRKPTLGYCRGCC
jgi:hypothetical protein